MAHQQQGNIYLSLQLLNTLKKWSADVIRNLGRNSVTETHDERQRRRRNKVAILYGFPVGRAVQVEKSKNTQKTPRAEAKLNPAEVFDFVVDDFVIVHESSVSRRLEFEREVLDASCFIPGGARPVGIWYRQVVEVGISDPSDVDSSERTDFNLQEIRRNADAAVERLSGQYFPEFSQFFLGANGPVIVISCVRPSMSDASSPPRFENFFYRLTDGEKRVESHPGVIFDAAPPVLNEPTIKNSKTDTAVPFDAYKDFIQRKLPFRTRVRALALVKISDSKRRLLQNIETAFADLQDHLFPADRSTYFAFHSTVAGDADQQDRRVIIGVEKQAPIEIRRASRASSSTELSWTNSGSNINKQRFNDAAINGEDKLVLLSSRARKLSSGADKNFSNLSCRDFADYTDEKIDSATTDEKANLKGFYRILDSSRWLEAYPLLEGCASWQSDQAGRSPLITISSKSVMEIPIALDAVAFVHELTPLKFLPGFLEDALVRQLNATCYLLKLAVNASTHATQFASSSRERVVGSNSSVGLRHRSLSSSDSGEDLFSGEDAEDKLFYDIERESDDQSDAQRQDKTTERACKELFEFAPQCGHYFVDQPICRIFSVVNVPSASRVAHFINTRLASRLTNSFFLYANSTSNLTGTTPVMRPSLLTSGASIQANAQLLSNYLVCPHWYVKLPAEVTQTNMLVACCKGLYTYHHYMHENYNDKGWGCAYRSLQTVWSWLRLNGAVAATAKSAIGATLPATAAALLLPPQHRVVQQTLVTIGDKPTTFVGSKQWIGSMELGYFLNQHYGIECRYLRVESGEEMPTLARQLMHHFETEGCPVMIGGGQLAHTILGVAFRDNDGYCQWLVLDPHYTGSDNIDMILQGGWCGWKETSFWQKQHYYNLCLPRIAQR